MSDDQLTWDRYGTPCADEKYMAKFGLQVDPWNLDECRECEMCGGCLTHLCFRDDASALLHMDWFAPFASPGQTECGHIGRPAHLPLSEGKARPCQLPAEHAGKHRSRTGWSWTAKEAA